MNFSAGIYSTINANRAKERRFHIHRSTRYLLLSHRLLFLVNDMHKAFQVSPGEAKFSVSDLDRDIYSMSIIEQEIYEEHGRLKKFRQKLFVFRFVFHVSIITCW